MQLMETSLLQNDMNTVIPRDERLTQITFTDTDSHALEITYSQKRMRMWRKYATEFDCVKIREDNADFIAVEYPCDRVAFSKPRRLSPEAREAARQRMIQNRKKTA